MRPSVPTGSGPNRTRAVGVCLGSRGALVAVVHPDPPRLAAIAEVTWPVGLWLPAGPTKAAWSIARRTLARVRRRLGLPRWCPAAVVIEPCLTGIGDDPAGQVVADPLPRGAALLARAGLAQGWVIPTAVAGRWRTADLVIDPRLGPAVAGRRGRLAVGAALATFAAGRPPAPVTVPGPPDDSELADSPASVGVGWAVQRIDDPAEDGEPEDGEPAGRAGTKQR